jgi:hypothetical protein
MYRETEDSDTESEPETEDASEVIEDATGYGTIEA